MPASVRCLLAVLLTGLVALPSVAGGVQAPRKTLHQMLEADGYVAIPLQNVAGYLCVEARVNDKRVVLILDTGAPQSHLDPNRTRDLPWNRVDGKKPYSYCLIDSLQVGPIKTGSRNMFSHDLTDSNRPEEPGVDGLLGADILDPCAAVIDYPTRKLYLKPTPDHKIVQVKSSPVPAGMPMERCRVGFWNLTGRDVTLTVAGKSVTLAKNRETTFDLERRFTWRIDGRAERSENVPSGAASHEIVIDD